MKLIALFTLLHDHLKKMDSGSAHNKVPASALPAITSCLLSFKYLQMTTWSQCVKESWEEIWERFMDFWKITATFRTTVLNLRNYIQKDVELEHKISQTMMIWQKNELDRFDAMVVPINPEVPSMVRTWQVEIIQDLPLKEMIFVADFIQQLRFLNSNTHQKRLGSYYTPIGVILYILERLTDPLIRAKCPNNVFMDYACGMGNFVFITGVLLNIIAQEPQLLKTTEAKCRWTFIGMDIDSDAIKFAQILSHLLKFHPKYGPVAEQILFFETDTLEPLPQALYSNFGLENQPPFHENCVDLILSNPPYVSWGLGRVDKLHKTRENLYRTRYLNTAEYKISLYALFIERSVQLLRPGGMAGLIIPDSFLTGKYFSKLRNFLLNETWIKEIVLFPKSFWKHADSGDPVILIFQKKFDNLTKSTMKNRTSEILIKSASLQQNLVQIDQKNLMSSDYFRDQPKQRFRLFFTPETMLFVQIMEKNTVPLGDYFEIHHGIRSKTGVGKSRIFSLERQGTYWKPGLIAGNSVVPFHIDYRGHYLLTNPEYLFAGGFDPQQIEREKIILRRTGDRLIAAVDDKGLYHSNTLIYLIPKATSFHGLTLYALCAILNSQVINQYYQYITLKAKRSMAQVEIDTLEQLPLQVESKIFIELDKIARELHRLRNEWKFQSANLEQQQSWKDLIQLTELMVKNIYFRQL